MYKKREIDIHTYISRYVHIYIERERERKRKRKRKRKKEGAEAERSLPMSNYLAECIGPSPCSLH
jgi:hypothetical protein